MRILSCSLTLSDLKRGSQLKTRDSSNDPQAATYILATSRTNKGVKRHDRCNSKKYAQYVHRIQKGSVALTTVTKVPPSYLHSGSRHSPSTSRTPPRANL